MQCGNSKGALVQSIVTERGWS